MKTTHQQSFKLKQLLMKKSCILETGDCIVPVYHPPVCLGDHLWPPQGRATPALKVIFHVSTLHPSIGSLWQTLPSIQPVNLWTQQSYLNVNNVLGHNNIMWSLKSADLCQPHKHMDAVMSIKKTHFGGIACCYPQLLALLYDKTWLMTYMLY